MAKKHETIIEPGVLTFSCWGKHGEALNLAHEFLQIYAIFGNIPTPWYSTQPSGQGICLIHSTPFGFQRANTPLTDQIAPRTFPIVYKGNMQRLGKEKEVKREQKPRQNRRALARDADRQIDIGYTRLDIERERDR